MNATLVALVTLTALSMPDPIVDRLVRNLALSDVPGLRLSEPIAVHAAPKDHEIAEQVIGRLRAAGGRRIFIVAGTPDEASTVAQDRGARWLLEVERVPEALQARLRQVDAGLWSSPATGIFASALVTVAPMPIDLSAPLDNGGDPNVVGPHPAPGIYGPARELVTLAGVPLALAVCPDEPQSLIVLTRSTLYKGRFAGGWRIEAQLPLAELPPRPVRSRFPVGVAVCTTDRVAFATSDIDGGYEVDSTTLAVKATLSGAPIAADAGRWRLAALHEGTPAWRGVDGVLVWSHPGGRPDLAIVAEGALHRSGAPVGPTGLGGSAIDYKDRLLWIRTGLGPWGAPDEIQLGLDSKLFGEPFAFERSVRATALGRFTSGAWTLIVALRADESTALSALRVVLP